MPGMSQRSINLTNALVVTMFRHSLFVTGLVWLSGIAIAFMVVLVATRKILNFNVSSDGVSEPRARTYLRWAFGALWLFDGFLQFQASMPLGLANNVVAPMSTNTPSWLHAIMEHGIFLWNSHPISLAVGTAWLQVGIGLVLLVSNGRTGRIVGVVSAGWAALVWLIGNGAGGMFVSGASFLFGWPGATFFYVVAGVWLFVGPETFRQRFSTVTLRVVSVVVGVAALLQFLPSTQFWHGGSTNALTTMTTFMTRTAQPQVLAWFARHVGSLAATMGGGFNVVIILWLGVSAVGLWMAPPRRWRWPVWTVVTGCLFFWLTSEDTSVFGGLSTDVNSLLPLALLAWCASPSLVAREPRERRLSREMTSGAAAVVATFASAMIVFSTVLMAGTTFASAETTLYQAQNGPATAMTTKAASFTLTDQFDKTYALGEHPKRVTLLTFLDPRCWSDCPLLAKQLEHVRAELSANANLDIVAVAADPYHERLSDLRHFIAVRGLSHVKNFYFVTGKLSSVQKVWTSYGIGVSMTAKDKMSIHSDFMFLISPEGELRWVIPDNPLSSTAGVASAVSELRGLLASMGVN
ncbi:MAG TPA: SCO family protein [Acidimicrobiales bacterium]|nr:SCO family protein [Acidimicrobiales bacterium]